MTYLACLVLFVVSIWMLSTGVNGSAKRSAVVREYETKLREKYGNAVASYMVNDGLSRRKAQKRFKMETLDRENKRRDFTATVDCPKCGFFAVHWILGGRRGRITRQCRECNHEWIQE
jgi:ABC-type siderophore export system fused ATPase/permease subunit